MTEVWTGRKSLRRVISREGLKIDKRGHKVMVRDEVGGPLDQKQRLGG